ncbi:FG-GAP-like repeat-containing protein [Kitasatospora albolonga]|uniref:FG-GAP-like repeat-containing protein n=2 Tax=Kitasatospora albolonga TaxID=68173 RepID=UPI0035EA878D
MKLTPALDLAVTLTLTTALCTAGAWLTARPVHAASARGLAPAPMVLRVMPLGDSITAGDGSSTGAGYRLPLYRTLSGRAPGGQAPGDRAPAERPRYSTDFVGSGAYGAVPDPDHEGHSGSLIDQIAPGVDGWLAAAQPDVVLLHLGVNDLLRGERAHAPDRLSALIDRITAARPGATVLALGLIPTTHGVESAAQSFNSSMQEAISARQRSGAKVRYVTPPSLVPATELPDGLHPNDRGYARLAEAYARALDQAVADGLAVRPAPHRAGTESGGAGRDRWADFDGDGRADRLVIADGGAVRALLNRGGDGHGGWHDLGQIATGTTTDRTRVRLADLDGDGRTDYLTLTDNGAVTAHLNRGGDGHGGWQNLGQIATGTTTDRTRVRLADLDGDGRTDYLTLTNDGAVTAHLNRGGDGHGGWHDLGRIATGVTVPQQQVEFADFDGDTHADRLVTDGATWAALYAGGPGQGGWTDLGQIATGP